MKMLLLFWGRRRGPWPQCDSLVGSTGRYQAASCPMEWRVRGQGLAWYGGTSLLFLQWQVRITVSPALLLSSLSFMCSQDFNCKEDRRKKKQPSTLSLLSLQRYETSFFMVCCKNRAFFLKTNTSSKTFKELFWIYLEMTPVYIACKFILEYIIMENYKW